MDHLPLREAAGKEARKKMREVARLNEALFEFERTIRPGYERWEQENLSALLDEEKRLDVEIHRLERIIDRVHMESLWGDRSRKSVYQDIVREDQILERARQRDQERSSKAQNPFEEQGGQSHSEDPDDDEDAGFPDIERAFRTYVRFACGHDPDDLNKREYRRMFADFCKWRGPQDGGALRPGRGLTGELRQRVKELYRVLVRRLHPDSGGSHDDANRALLWHDLQEAYASQDVERMEVLLALTDLHRGHDAMHSTLYHLRKVAREMEDAARKLKARLRDAHASNAWAFWNAKDREKAGADLRAKVQSRLHDAKRQLAMLEKEVSAWQTKAKPKQKKASPDVPGQNFFDF